MKIAIVLATSALSLCQLAAQAATPTEEPHTVTVQFADLNLDRKPGIAKLYLRIKNAAKRVCDQQANTRLAARQAYDVCVERAVSIAVARINRPMLSDYVVQRGGKLPKEASAHVAVR
jgi:UrcA family protein